MPWQPWGAIGPKSGGCVGPVLESRPTPVGSRLPVELVELDVLDEGFALVVDVPLVVASVALGPAPNVDEAESALLQARQASRASGASRPMSLGE